MEGFGVEKMMQQLKDANLTVTQVVYDKDASTMKQVMTVFEDVEEGLCLSIYFLFFILIILGHGAKNFKKQIQKLGKSFPELKKFANRSASGMKRIIKLSLGDESKFKLLVEQKIDHYCGKHKECAKPEQCQKFKHIVSLDAKKAFVVIFCILKKLTFKIECLVFFCRNLLLIQNGRHHKHCGRTSCC